jgi:predicted transcriptional regulator
MSGLVKAGLIIRRNGNYFLTSFGKVVYEAQMLIGKAKQSYWKLKAIDSIESSSHELTA